MADIFVSYASEDRDRVAPLVDHLQSQGWSVWWDRDLVAGPSFEARIQDTLDQARCVVVVWSRTSVKSHWCRDEAQEGLDRGVLVPVLIDDILPPLGFRSSHSAALIGWPDGKHELRSLLAGVEECLETSAPHRVSAKPSGRQVIAVLPFENMSNDPEQDFFCDGISEELINALVARGEFDVIARSSAFQFKNRHQDVRRVAATLGADFVLDGSVRKAGSRVRVTAKLVDGAHGTHLWTSRYDRQLTDIFTVEDEITAAIVQALSSELGALATPSVATANAAAYDAYLRGTHELAANVNEMDRARRAMPHLEEALALDPQFADAWGMRAQAQFDMGLVNPDLDGLCTSIERALEIDPRQSSALRVQAALEFYQNYDAQAALNALAAILRQRPSDERALSTFAWTCFYADQDIDYEELTSRILRLDPLREPAYRFRALWYWRTGRYDESLAEVRRVLQFAPDNVPALELMISYGRAHDDQAVYQDALTRYRSIVGPNSFLAEAFNSTDSTTTLERLKARERPGGNIRLLDAARAYAYLGDHAAAIAKYRDFVGASAGFFRLNYARSQLLRPLLQYPEYQALLATIGCDDATLSRIRPPSIR